MALQIHPPPQTVVVAVAVECVEGQFASTKRETGSDLARFTFADLPSGEECGVLIGAFDRDNHLLKRELRTFFTPI